MDHRRYMLLRLTVAALAVAALAAGCARPARRPGEVVLRYRVAAGDSLEGIANEYYGDPHRDGEIRRLNDIGRHQEPAVGSVLRIPMTPEDMAAMDQRRRARSLCNDGLDLVERGSFLNAIGKFDRAIALDPRFAEAHFNLGATYQRMKVYDKALDAFKKAADLRPDDADYRYAVGNALFHLGRYGRAVDAFRRALRIDPSHLKAQFSLAAALEKDGRADAARREWQRYLEMDPDSEWADQARRHLDQLGR